ncbi:MAG: A/G-specific adenine glycosylase [Candidatus Eremiobacterota bacterium]
MRGAFQALVEHYRRTRRPLPWRERADPYAILVSEVMLQQTRVGTVLPYYERFLARFPSFQALAEADEQSLLAAWAGLGYYRRARNLQAAAREVVRLGGFPATREGLRRLPGVGDYTAAALESILYNRPALALDGNAIRVLWRFLGLRDDPATPIARRKVTALVEPAIPPETAGDFTQALMELGATLCKPARPACPSCPLSPECRAWRSGRPEDYPPPLPAGRTVPVLRAAALAEWQDRVLLVQETAGGLLQGLWQCPTVEVQTPEQAASALSDLLEAFGEPGPLAPAGEVRHAITFRRIRCLVYRCTLSPDRVGEGGTAAWVRRADLSDWPVPSATRRMLKLLRG